MSYYTYEGDSLVLANDPPNAVYVPRDDGYGNFRYYILDSAGRMVGSTLTAPPAGTRVAPASAMNENGQIDILQIPEIAGRSTTTPQMADIQNSLAQGGIYNSPDGKYSIIGGGDANTPSAARSFAVRLAVPKEMPKESQKAQRRWLNHHQKQGCVAHLQRPLADRACSRPHHQ